ncbi:T-lymphocyte surface antigen Ly-9-like isoform X2 [Sebastes umbrosus]|uniref:T-lymphocyte surface antigen Ly-9-like isoform X2 n=1 Tax=Sebastes umbrosus TaxID=72105 RepID=UPI00189EB539|nr:T-lymphocyte surface antigen Ly-9-like isoform X2 [Sebastes umbrosus]
MCPSGTSITGWLCVLLAVVSADPVKKVYKKVGDKIVLKPDTVPVKIPIIWKEGNNIAMQWEGMETDSYRQFLVRGSLNTSSGEMTITGLTRNDSGLYTPEINDVVQNTTHLIVISPVPKPTVSESCDDEKTSCTLTCDGDTTDAEPVTYRWKSGDTVTASTKEHRITKNDSSSISEFICELENPVSQESSLPVPNRLTTAPGGKLNISMGVTVFIGLLIVVMLLVSLHRWSTGMWFFQKTSMPWEADFWRRHERPQTEAAESNGTNAQELEQTDEETPMK